MPSYSRTTHYHRFIPSEEVEVAASWKFKPIDTHETHPDPTQAERQTPSPEGLETMRQQAYAEGYEQGRLAGAQETRSAMEQQVQIWTHEQATRMADLMKQAEQHFDQLEHVLADQLLGLACDIARQVIRRELNTPQESLQAVTREALALMVEDGRPVTLRVNPDDALLLKSAWDSGQTPIHVRLEPDPKLIRGSCVVESAQGAVDGRLEKRWARAVANLGMEAPWQPGEDADV